MTLLQQLNTLHHTYRNQCSQTRVPFTVPFSTLKSLNWLPKFPQSTLIPQNVAFQLSVWFPTKNMGA